ncbi:DUF3853 family protein [Dysgonomonas sp. 216]|uniref:DUF3853 family protein n=1 Tax=Dysgonomonas sp. 216 TaxID=2302934 RepID=UPI0013D899AA|nr:DUF3853 family protein [Dysgonomonas sp. 216]
MNIEELRSKPLWQMTGEEFLFLQEQGCSKQEQAAETNAVDEKFVYGYAGLAKSLKASVLLITS